MVREDRAPQNILKCIRGFLIYVDRNYKWMMPYLKGVYLKIYGWIEGRDKDFYKTNSQPQFSLKVWE